MTLPSSLPTIDDLRDDRGRFSMLAIDQRESLRQMLAKAAGVDTVGDQALVDFKIAVVSTLSPLASATLIDRTYGAEAARLAECPIILAADHLYSDGPGLPVNRAELDEEVDAEVIAEFGASALKMLVPWLPDSRDAAIELSARFMEVCRKANTLGIVEGVVRPSDYATWSDEQKNEAIVAAAADLGSTGPDLYKAEVPLFGVGDPDVIVATAQRITDAIDCPWVVLSSGVAASDFANAVALSRAGGASGFLAGRAVWMDAIPAADPKQFLATESADRLRLLSSAD